MVVILKKKTAMKTQSAIYEEFVCNFEQANISAL